MTSRQRYQPRSVDVAAEDFDGEYVVLDMLSGKYFSLAGPAAIVWRGLMAGHSLATLCARLPDADPRRVGVEAFIAGLVGHDLIKPASSDIEPPVAIADELAASTGGFEIEVFEDLSDLLVADPIHDVDPEAGWPHLPPKD